MTNPFIRSLFTISSIAAFAVLTGACSASAEEAAADGDPDESADGVQAPKRRTVAAKGELSCADAQFTTSGTLRGKFITAMATELGKFCKEQNDALKKSGKASCGTNYCMKSLAINWEPPTINVTAKAAGTGAGSSPGGPDAPTAQATTVAWDINVAFTAKLGKTTALQCENPLNHPTVAAALSPDVIAKFDKRLEAAIAKCPDE
jgi:hypothetical protein